MLTVLQERYVISADNIQNVGARILHLLYHKVITVQLTWTKEFENPKTFTNQRLRNPQQGLPVNVYMGDSEVENNFMLITLTDRVLKLWDGAKVTFKEGIITIVLTHQTLEGSQELTWELKF